MALKMFKSLECRCTTCFGTQFVDLIEIYRMALEMFKSHECRCICLAAVKGCPDHYFPSKKYIHFPKRITINFTNHRSGRLHYYYYNSTRQFEIGVSIRLFSMPIFIRITPFRSSFEELLNGEIRIKFGASLIL